MMMADCWLNVNRRGDVRMAKRDEISLILNKEQAKLILEALSLVDDNKKSEVPYQRLKQQVELIHTVWCRRGKNEKILKSLEKPRPKKPMTS